MKPNEAPEKIYLQVCCDCTLNNKETCEQCCKDNPINNGREVTWCVDKIFDNDVEYTRTDDFIEKALSWLKNHYRDYMYNPTGKRLEAFFGIDMCNDFENYMKGENI